MRNFNFNGGSAKHLTFELRAPLSPLQIGCSPKAGSQDHSHPNSQLLALFLFLHK